MCTCVVHSCLSAHVYMYRYIHIRLTTVCFPATCTPASVDDGMQMYVGRNRHVAASRRNSDQTAFLVLFRASLHATHSLADMQARIDDQCTHHELNVGHSSHGREMGRGQNARQQSERMNPVTGKLGDKRRRATCRSSRQTGEAHEPFQSLDDIFHPAISL